MKSPNEKELLNLTKSNLQIIESDIIKKKYSLEEISDILPGIFHINTIQDFAIKYVNKYGEEKYNISLDEILKVGDEFVLRFFEPGALEYFSQPLIQMVKEDDDSKIISFF